MRTIKQLRLHRLLQKSNCRNNFIVHYSIEGAKRMDKYNNQSKNQIPQIAYAITSKYFALTGVKFLYYTRNCP